MLLGSPHIGVRIFAAQQKSLPAWVAEIGWRTSSGLQARLAFQPIQTA
jgi:hypothetical protein